jgi:hypothetical protein
MPGAENMPAFIRTPANPSLEVTASCSLGLMVHTYLCDGYRVDSVRTFEVMGVEYLWVEVERDGDLVSLSDLPPARYAAPSYDEPVSLSYTPPIG